ncbi:MAG: nuclear transport factor 2 family protein [Gammaproteobacteria bacterium]|nr:nuclear transport factor 2 family protein [Gammaproteobacteria bacterium]NND38831.1 SnoaL-like domain-containing protein [Pseudomonadales bacterium]NNM10472.1 SnoaL-like domain-containing protein [Pseudomonadales bacterium]
MNILVVGGTGPLGSYIALHLKAEGHEVSIASRNLPQASHVASALPWLACNYLNQDVSQDSLAHYQAIVFAAGSDPRHVPEGEDPDAHFLHANGEMLPAFARRARDAGVAKFIHIGSFYPHVLPGYIESNVYVRSRHLAAQRVCELSNNKFSAISLDAPFVVGMPKGMKDPMWMAYLSYARGIYADVESFGPAGGTNFISVRSLAQAVSGALARGEAGKAYLLGDENLSFARFFQYFFNAVGKAVVVASIDRAHPMLPDEAIMQGRGNTVAYEPDSHDVEVLGYQRNDVGPMIEQMASEVNEMIGPIDRVVLGEYACFDPDLYALSAKYCWAMDNADKTMLRSVFTDDAVLKGPGFRHDGIDEILAIPDLLASFFYSTRHETTQQLVEIKGSSAHGETLCVASHVLQPEAGQQPQQVLTWRIRYQDNFIKEGEQWRIAKRSLILDWIDLQAVHHVIH